jgi:hypothetical protein
MQWLFELSAACALIALAFIPLFKFIAAPAQRLRRAAPRGGKFWLDATLVPAPARAPAPTDPDAAS